MNNWSSALRLTGMGFYIAVCLILGVFGGIWLDNKLDLSPLFVFCGLALGLGLAAYGVFKMIRSLRTDTDDKEHHR